MPTVCITYCAYCVVLLMMVFPLFCCKFEHSRLQCVIFSLNSSNNKTSVTVLFLWELSLDVWVNCQSFVLREMMIRADNENYVRNYLFSTIKLFWISMLLRFHRSSRKNVKTKLRIDWEIAHLWTLNECIKFMVCTFLYLCPLQKLIS